MRPFVRFCALWLKVAWEHKNPVTDIVGAVSLLVAGVGFLLIKIASAQSLEVEVIAGWVALVGLGLIVLARVVLAPYRIVTERDSTIGLLKAELSEYKEGPKFVVSYGNPAIGIAAVGPEGAQLLAVTVPVRVTNDGAAGAALGWRVILKLATGESAIFAPLAFDELLPLRGELVGGIKREDLISEKTARRVERGSTEWGRYVGSFADATLDERISSDTVFRVECRDARGNIYFAENPLGGQASTVSPTPTLPTVGSKLGRL